MSTGRDIDADRAATLAVLAGRRPVADGRTNWLGHRLGSGAAQIDEKLLAGATMAEMSRSRGAAENHLRHLRESHGLEVVESGGVFRFAGASPGPAPAVAASAQSGSAAVGSYSPPKSAPARPPKRMTAPPMVEVTGTLTTQAGDPAGRMQRTKLILEIVAVAITVISGVVALILRFRS